MTRKGNVAILAGNGLSIAFNPDLDLTSITEEVTRRIEQAEGGDVVLAMKELADRALTKGATSSRDFELLVGAFEAESRTLDVLDSLAELTQPTDKTLREAIRRTAEFAEQVRDSGVSHVLEVISERSHAYFDKTQDLHTFVSAITTAFGGKIVVGNLNYDTLLLAALLTVCQADLADMGHGYQTLKVIVNDGHEQTVNRLRESRSGFPSSKRVQLLHLHGSLTFWSEKGSTVVAKLPREMLEGPDQWQAVREGTTNVRPVVVLANRRDKAEHVVKYPFNLAYEMFSAGLSQADRWLIVGYSFKDDPVNSALRKEFIERVSKPRVSWSPTAQNRRNGISRERSVGVQRMAIQVHG